MKNIYKATYKIFKNGKYMRDVSILYVSGLTEKIERLREDYPESEGYELVFVSVKKVGEM